MNDVTAHSHPACRHPSQQCLLYLLGTHPQAELAAHSLLLCCLQVLDDSTFATLSSLMLFNSVDILQGLLKDPRFFPELFRRLSTVKAGVRTFEVFQKRHLFRRSQSVVTHCSC